MSREGQERGPWELVGAQLGGHPGSNWEEPGILKEEAGKNRSDNGLDTNQPAPPDCPKARGLDQFWRCDCTGQLSLGWSGNFWPVRGGISQFRQRVKTGTGRQRQLFFIILLPEI